MGTMYPLKPLSQEAIPAALDKAERYRLLNEPGQAESICLDVLAVDAHNQHALVTMILALTDQFSGQPAEALQRARAALARLDGEYDRVYYDGIICERRARAQLAHGGHGSAQAAREWLKDALRHFERAEGIRPHGNDDAILRWNACVRLLERHPEVGDLDDDQSRLLMLE
jgi:ATP/maltotriose-dependent transcriptional regulator MalT